MNLHTLSDKILCRTSTLSTPTLLGNALLLLAVTLMFVTSLTFILGGVVQPWMFPASVAVSIVYILLNGGLSRRWKCAVWLPVTVVGSLFIAASIHDHTYDTYHQEIAVAIANGWNPVYPYSQPLEFWSVYYLKLIETMQGCIVSTTGKVDAGKTINLIFVFALLFSAVGFLSDRVKSKGHRAAIIVVMLCCPVLLASMLTSYIDIYLYIYTCLTLMLFVKIGQQPSPRLWGWLVAVTLLSAGTKLNIFFYQIVYLLCFLGWILWHRRRTLIWGWAISALVTTVLIPILFWHPYITNMITMGNPAYPLLGAGSTDIMSINTPEIFLNVDNRFANFFLSLIGGYDPGHSLFITYDSRIGGFGYFFLPILVIVLWRAIVCRRTWSKTAMAMMLMIFLTGFAFEQTWWARYICQLWVIPVIAMVCMQRDTTSLWRNIVLALSLATACQALPSVIYSIGYTIHYNIYADTMRGTSVKVDYSPSILEACRLEEMDVSVIQTPEGTLDPANTLYLRTDRFYVEPDTATYHQIHTRLHTLPPLLKKITLPNSSH